MAKNILIILTRPGKGADSMNKILLFISCFMLIFSLAACSGNASGQQPEDTSAASVPVETETSQQTDANRQIRITTDEGDEVQIGAADDLLSVSADAESENASPQYEQAPTYSAEELRDLQESENTSENQIQLPKQTSQETIDEISTEESITMKMNVQIGNNTFTASLEENAAAEAFIELMREAPVVIQMNDYSGFEKVGSIGTSLPTSNSQITTQSGDIVLYNGNQIVIFYGSNSWSYTRIGKIDNLSGWEEALGAGDVTATFSIA